METDEFLGLFQRAKEGDLDAFERIFERCYNTVLAIVRRRLGARMREVVESGDVLNDVMVRAIQNFSGFDVGNRTELLALFVHMVKQGITDAARYHGAQKRDRDRVRALRHVTESIASGRLVLEPAADAPAILDHLSREEEKEIAKQCLAELDPTDRAAIESRTIHADASWDEMAALLGAPSADAARHRVQRAMIALKKRYDRARGGDRPSDS